MLLLLLMTILLSSCFWAIVSLLTGHYTTAAWEIESMHARCAAKKQSVYLLLSLPEMKNRRGGGTLLALQRTIDFFKNVKTWNLTSFEILIFVAYTLHIFDKSNETGQLHKASVCPSLWTRKRIHLSQLLLYVCPIRTSWSNSIQAIQICSNTSGSV